eukprot:842897-Rhodomonas_salina.1
MSAGSRGSACAFIRTSPRSIWLIRSRHNELFNSHIPRVPIEFKLAIAGYFAARCRKHHDAGPGKSGMRTSNSAMLLRAVPY